MQLQYVQSRNAKVSGKKFAAVCRELETIEKRDGSITPHAIVKQAEKKSSALHDLFEWENTKAAHQWRLWQARMVIRSVSIQFEEKEDVEPIRAFVSIIPLENEQRFDQRSYRSTQNVMAEPDYRDQLLERAKAELRIWQKRYNNITEFAKVYAAIADIAGEE